MCSKAICNICWGFPSSIERGNMSPTRLNEAQETAEEHLLRREHGHKAERPGRVQQSPVGQRHEVGCPSRVCRVEVDRDVTGSNLAPSEEAGRLVIRQQGIEGIDGIPLVAWSLDLEDHLDALHLPSE